MSVKDIVESRDLYALRQEVKNCKTTQDLIDLFREIEELVNNRK